MKHACFVFACAALVAACNVKESPTLAVTACEAGACGKDESCDFDPLTGAAICVHTCGPSEAGALHEATECPQGTQCWSPTSTGACVQTCKKADDCAPPPTGFFAACVDTLTADGDAGSFAVCHYVPYAPEAGARDAGIDVRSLFDAPTGG